MSLLNIFKDFFPKYRLNDPNIKTVFDHYFFDLKYYLHQDCSIEEFSILLNITSEKLDQIAHQNYGCSFQSLLNERRYSHLMDEIESPINSNLSIESIIKLSGFTLNENFVDLLKSKQNADILSDSLLANSHTKNPKSS
jgi:AraC-like DNA-binding protein